MARNIVTADLFRQNRRRVLITGTPPVNEEYLFAVNHDMIPAGIHVSGHASDTYILKSLMTPTDNQALISSGTYKEVITDGSDFDFDINSSVRALWAPGVYILVAPAVVNGACDALLCW